MISLTSHQQALLEIPWEARIFLQGPAGSGKTTSAVERLLRLLETGAPGDQVLLLVPQRTLGDRYYEAINSSRAAAGGQANLLTLGGLAQRMVDLYWPLVAGPAGFAYPERPPVFLTLETAQYYMARVVRPLLENGYFQSATIERNRIYSQILDNLNKAALVGFPFTEIGTRLKGAWLGDVAQARLYDDAQDCAGRFRGYCLEHNLLDFSLQIEVFQHFLWPDPDCRSAVKHACRYIIADNIEEDTPAAHNLLAELLPECASALLVYDQQAGYRSFLGADPASALELARSCDTHLEFTQSLVTPPGIEAFGRLLVQAISPQVSHELLPPEEPAEPISAADAIQYETHRYYPQMAAWVAESIAALVEQQGASPGQIVVLAPFLTDTLRFTLADRLERLGIPVRSHRPSRPLREEPATLCLLTLAALAHPGWSVHPSRYDVAYALLQTIEGLDLVRAQLLAEIVYRPREGTLTSFDQIRPDTQERITYILGQRYEHLRLWLEEYRSRPAEELDFFFGRIFGELLSQPDYRFHSNYTAGEVAANLIDSAKHFRWGVVESEAADNRPLGREYLDMVQEGVVAAQYIRSWRAQPDDAVLLAPAYTFLLSNRPVDYQFWLDIGSRAWYERLNQPLTHPYVLSRAWVENRAWSDADEVVTDDQTLCRVALGLARRCRRKIYLGLSELNEQGFEYQGPLLKAFQRVLRQIRAQ